MEIEIDRLGDDFIIVQEFIDVMAPARSAARD